MIKIIHYCWFGNSVKTELVERCISSWKEMLPDWEFMEWNESNVDLNENSFISEAFFLKKYAFVSDYIRLKALYELGGLYLDTDVEMIKDISKLCEKGSFIGMETDTLYGTGIIYSEPKAEWIKRMLSYYTSRHFFKWDGVLNTMPNTYVLTELYPNQSIPTKVYPVDFLAAKDWRTGEIDVTENTYTIHHYTTSWVSKKKINRKIFRFSNIILRCKYILGRFFN